MNVRFVGYRATRSLLVAGVLAITVLGVSACGSSSSSSTATTAAPTTMAPSTTTSVPCGTNPGTGAPTPLCWNQDFVSPSKNIQCYFGPQTQNNPTVTVSCQSFNKPSTVMLSVNEGIVYSCSASTTCNVGNGPVGMQVMPYGSSVTTNGYLCKSETAGVTCTVQSTGKGFLISDTGVQSIG